MTLQFVPYGLRVGLLCVIYFAMARFGLSLDAVSGFAVAVWPPTGMALIALVLGGYCLWPGIALGAFLVNLSAGAPVLVACGMALGNTLEALVGAILLKRVAGFQPIGAYLPLFRRPLRLLHAIFCRWSGWAIGAPFQPGSHRGFLMPPTPWTTA